ncbi:MAG: zinc metalloprotease HtpX [Candidatus Methanomethylicia archaeon]|jgi:heat shock protein HtpX|nr:zinc metalloprotease HtpX [Candidatus Methanomethylicia archaeon]MCQ5374474.1 zinc metalloprotease HtpX [Candidatus Methanomethylicia archaeon]
MMTVLTAIFVILGYVVGLFLGYPELVSLGALVLAGALNLISYLYSDRIVLSMSRAKVVSESEYPDLHRIVTNLATSAGLPKPRVAIIKSKVPNAFATGRGPKNSVVAVTTGLLEILNENELEGVLSHEISHIKHRDVLVASVAATIAGAISYLALVGRYSVLFGGGSDRNRNAGALAFLLSLLAPLAAFLIQMAISRGREYEADREGALLSRKPLSLASALEKIERTVRSAPPLNVNPSTSPLWIVNPFRGDALLEMFSTHPSTWKRIERLKAMAVSIGSMR